MARHEAPKERLDYVDGLRAVAVLSVIAFHSAMSNPAVARDVNPLTQLLRQGCHGVELFFVVSGFCLSYPVLKEVYARGAFRFDLCAYLSRRILRIVPPYFGAVACVVSLYALLRWLDYPLPPSMSVAGAFAFDKVLAQLLFLDGGGYYANTDFWTLFVEFRWYFLFPGLIWLWVRSTKAFVVAGCALVVAFLLTRVNSVDVATLPAFMLGMYAAHLRLRPNAAAKYAPVAALAGFALGLTQTPDTWMGFITVPTEIAAFGIVVSAGYFRLFQRILQIESLTTVGRYSYGIYLVHDPIVGLVNRLLANELPPSVLVPVAAAAGIAVGIWFSRIFEQPLLHGALRRRALEVLEPAVRRLWTSMPGERGIELTLLALPEQNESVRIAV